MKMILPPALVLACAMRSVAFSPSDALAPAIHRPRPVRLSSTLSYASDDYDCGEPLLPPELRRQVEQSTKRRRAMPHFQIASHDEANGEVMPRPESGGNDATRHRRVPQQQRPAEGVRPLRSIRWPVHRSRQEPPPQGLPLKESRPIGIQAPNLSSDVRVISRSNGRRSRLSLLRQPQLDEYLDRPEQLQPHEDQRKGARRVTFKATREASISMTSKPGATLTQYMTQPVRQYSLLSFHDAEGSNMGDRRDSGESKRRWIVRRLTKEEAKRYIDIGSCDEDVIMDESNLFRLAVPLLPLIGWDLTPVIDLEVVPPEMDAGANEMVTIDKPAEASSSKKWAPLRGIRQRIRDNGDETNCSDGVDHSPVVNIRSLRVSLLSTQEEVHAVMSNSNSRANNLRGRTMQREALEMVGRVEEWLRPHISFEAELAWDDALSCGSDPCVGSVLPPSTVTVKSTAVTSLTIPRIPSDILRKTVPSGFLVKRLGSTLTSRALAVCLPRFLRQLEKDYVRWSGTESGAGGDGGVGNVPGNVNE